MSFPLIEKESGPVRPNLGDYQEARDRFAWSEAFEELDFLPGGGLNIAYECVDRHVVHGRGEKVALRWLAVDGEVRDYTYSELAILTSRFASALERIGVKNGERVFVLCGRIPELYVAMLGTLKRGAVFSPLFSAFGPEPIRQRISSGDGRVLVTTSRLYAEKVAPLRGELPDLEHVIVIGDEAMPETHGFDELLQSGDQTFETVRTEPEDMALLHFTSGTTGKPKGAIHVHQAVLAHHVTGRLALDFHEEDIFWCTADPGWVTGTSYGIIAPLTNGLTMIVDQGEFSAKRWYQILQDQKVTNWYTAPTAIRMLMKAGPDLAQGYDLSALRFIASVGEPLNPEAVVWGEQVLGLPIHDNWWQSETGGIMISNYASMPIKPGSMGKPLPGIEAAIVEREGEKLHIIEEPDIEGELVLKAGWPSMFRGYLHMEERYRSSFMGDWYLTGDIAKRDPDGYYWFVGRADDLIKSAGHLIGPFEVESALIEHEAVAEAAVIGKPHPVAMETVKAFVTLHNGFEPTKALRRELMAFAREKLGPAVAPREIDFVEDLPRTRSGKIMRRLLKARELGLPEGDTSTLEK